ncbi:MAG TPA: hypothetical protein VIF10_14440 [Methylobacter sp.]
MANDKDEEKKLGLKKHPLRTMKIELPIRNCTIGYPNTVKIKIAGQVLDVHGPIEITNDNKASPEHRISINWTEEE